MNAPVKPARPVTPRDAASLVLLREAAGEPEVLMGRRHSRHAFIPDAFVFPGGKLDKADARIHPARDFEPGRTGTAITAELRALAAAAVRETFEETGLLLARHGDVGAPATDTWAEFRRMGLAPDYQPMSLIARAITPTESPIRFHARFFVAENAELQGEIKGSGELLDLGWYPLSKALKLPVIDVTEFVLTELRKRTQTDTVHGPVAFWRYRSGKPILSYTD